MRGKLFFVLIFFLSQQRKQRYGRQPRTKNLSQNSRALSPSLFSTHPARAKAAHIVSGDLRAKVARRGRGLGGRGRGGDSPLLSASRFMAGRLRRRTASDPAPQPPRERAGRAQRRFDQAAGERQHYFRWRVSSSLFAFAVLIASIGTYFFSILKKSEKLKEKKLSFPTLPYYLQKCWPEGPPRCLQRGSRRERPLPEVLPREQELQ